MEAVSYICNGTNYNIIPIVDTSDISSDIAKVIDAIQDTDLDVYTSNMEKSVEQGLAFSLYVNDLKVGFAYNYMDGDKYTGASIYVNYDSVATILVLRTIFEINDSHKLSFVPHIGNLAQFKSMCTGQSIRAYHSVGSPVVVLRETIYEKGFKAFHYLGIK